MERADENAEIWFVGENRGVAATAEHPVMRLCFVCTGNICRSPMAEVIMRALARARGLGERLKISSAGTGEWHVGERADPRTRQALARAGYNGDDHRAKQFDATCFGDYDLILTFDRSQQRILTTWAGTEGERALIQPLLTFHPVYDERSEVPDPYYGDDELFDCVRDLIEQACRGLLEQIEPVLLAS